MLVILSGAITAYSAPIMPGLGSATNENQILIADIPEADVRLYANRQSIKDDLYREFTLCFGMAETQFTWEHTTNKTWEPVLLLEDLTSDSKKDLVVKLVQGTGSGVHEENVHILDADTLDEFEIQSIENILETNVKMETYENSYEIQIDDLTYVIDKTALDSSEQHLFSELGFQSPFYKFEVKDNKLIATALLPVSPTEFGGEFSIEYTYKNHEFIMASIMFNKYE
jgi:hypothetical protein